MTYTVSVLETIIGYKFRNAQRLWEAVQAPGSVVRAGQIASGGVERHSIGFQSLPDGNKRLALVGDTVLRLALCESWYFRDEVRERLHRILEDVGSNANLAKVGRTHGLESLINDNPTSVGKGSVIAPLSMAGTVEAIIGAVYIDGGMKPVPGVMQKLGLMPKTVRKTEPKSAVKIATERPDEARTDNSDPVEVLKVTPKS